MARTSLFRSLQSIAHQHAAADQYGVDVDRFREQQAALAVSDFGMSRRTLLKGALAAGAGAAVLGTGIYNPSRAYAAPEGRNPSRVAIVGAGIAGLTAALTLRDKGYTNVTVYEANPSRIGGRIWTNRPGFWADGQLTEWGGELIDSGHATMRGLAKRYGIKEINILDTPYEDLYFFDGQYYSVAQSIEDYAPVHAAIKRDMSSFTWPVTYNSSSRAGVALSNMTIKEWIETRVPGGLNSQMGRLLDVAYTIEFGADIDKQSAISLLGLIGYKNPRPQFTLFGVSDEKYRFEGGNDQIIHAIADEIGRNRIEMGHALRTLKRNTDGTSTLTFSAGGRTKTVTADQVILALPLHIMRDIFLAGGFTQSGFDPQMRETVLNYPMGENNKVHMQFTDRVWNRDGHSGSTYADTGYQCSWEVTSKQAGTAGILNQYPGGTPALQQRSGVPFAFGSTADGGSVASRVRDIASRALSQMDAAMPGLASRWTGRATVSLWGGDPYTKGAYAYYPPGYPHKYAGYEEVSQGNVHMAGEWVSIDYQGYMEGGAVTGIAAANKVLAATRTTK